MTWIVDSALSRYPAVRPSVYVDDISAECSGTPERVINQLGGFITLVAVMLSNDGHRISEGRSKVVASSARLADELTECWSHIGDAGSPDLEFSW